VAKLESWNSQEESMAYFIKIYKLVALRVKPVLDILSGKFRILQNIQRNPLLELLKQPSKFVPKTGTYLRERKNWIRTTVQNSCR